MTYHAFHLFRRAWAAIKDWCVPSSALATPVPPWTYYYATVKVSGMLEDYGRTYRWRPASADFHDRGECCDDLECKPCDDSYFA